MADPLGDQLRNHDLYLDGEISYDELKRRNASSMPTNMISGQTTEVSSGGTTITTFHLTEEGRRGLTCDAEAFRRIADASIEYYRREALDERKLAVTHAAIDAMGFLGGLLLAITMPYPFLWLGLSAVMLVEILTGVSKIKRINRYPVLQWKDAK